MASTWTADETQALLVLWSENTMQGDLVQQAF